VVLGPDGLAKGLERRIHDLQSTPIECAQRLSAPHEVEGGPLLAGTLADEQGAIREVEGRQTPATRYLAILLTPMEMTADHEVQDEEVIGGEDEDDLLAQPLKALQRQTLQGFDRRIGRAEEKGMCNANTLELLASCDVKQSLNVDDYLRVFRHCLLLWILLGFEVCSPRHS
jgi:hypothetical protein